MNVFNFISLFGGLSLFLYGMRLMGNGLKSSSSGALKKAMEKVTNNPFIGFVLGLVVTALIQSSTATIVLTSGLVGAGIITLHQSVGVILGANVGTTITAQIIRLLDIDSGSSAWINVFKPSTLAPVAAIIGILLIMAFHFRNSDIIGGIAMGFGILFTGLLTMTSAVAPLSESASFANLFASLSDKPVLGFLAGTGVAAMIQSSSATIGILQAFSVTGALSFGSVYAIIIGVNIGDCVTTAIVCSIGSKADAKRTGIIHVLFNICASIIIVIAVTILHRTGALNSIWSKAISSGGIANTHTIFRLSCAVLLLPFCGIFEKMSRIIVKEGRSVGDNIDAELRGLDEKLLTSPTLAYAGVQSAISAMARLARNGVNDAMDCVNDYDKAIIDKVNANEQHIDSLADHVDNYLIKLSPHVPTGHANDLLNYYIQVFGEFERIGDYAVNLTEDAEELRDKNTVFSEGAKQELELMRSALNEILSYTYVAFVNSDYEAARRIEPLEEVVDDMVATLRNNHIKRLRNNACTVYAGITFLDILVSIERISDQCSNIGIYTLGLHDHQAMTSHHDYIRWLHQGGDEFYNTVYRETRQKYITLLEAIQLDEGTPVQQEVTEDVRTQN